MFAWLPKRNLLRNQSTESAEPEVWFRVVHVAKDGHPGVTVAAHREQTVEIALGTDAAFENGNVGTVTRRVVAERVVSTVPQPRRGPKPPRAPRTPRVVEPLRKAIERSCYLDAGEVETQSAIAWREGITRAW